MRFHHRFPRLGVTASLLLRLGLTFLAGPLWAQAPSSSAGTDHPGDSGLEVDHYRQVADSRGLGRVTGYGRGAAFVDIDGDGDDDLFVADTDGRFFGDPYGMSMFFLNDGSGHFVPAELQLDPDDFHSTWVGSFADYDNDGDPDLMVGNGGYTGSSTLVLLENRISQNQGFVNVTEQAGLWSRNGTPEISAWWGISWADYDNDGWLDVIVTRRAGRPLLFHNEGDGSFSEQGARLGIQPIGNQDTKNPVWIDYDEDGDQDLYIAGMDWHAFYRNDDGMFEDITEEIFPEPMAGRSELPVVFAAATADFDQDGHEDIYLGRWDSQDYILFGDGAGNFERLGPEVGLDTVNHVKLSDSDTQPFSNQSRLARRRARQDGQSSATDTTLPYENTMGLGVGDLFDDGYPDVVIGTGDPEFVAADIILCNRGRRQFERCTELFLAADAEHQMTRAHGAVFADINRDGFTDFFFNLGGHPNFDFAQNTESREFNKLFMRQTEEVANAAWLTLSGTRSNRDAIGARVRYGEGDLVRYHYVRSTMGFQSQNSMTLLLPLGGKESIPVTIDWPSGATTELTVTAGKLTNVVE